MKKKNKSRPIFVKKNVIYLVAWFFVAVEFLLTTNHIAEFVLLISMFVLIGIMILNKDEMR